MRKSVGIAELKSRLSEYLKRVRRGHSITVLDRDTPIARIVPYDAGGGHLVVRRPAAGAPKLQQVPLPPPLELQTDAVELLLQERNAGR